MTMMHSPEAGSAMSYDELAHDLDAKGWADLDKGRAVVRADIHDRSEGLMDISRGVSEHDPHGVEVYGVVDKGELKEKLDGKSSEVLLGRHATLLAMYNNGLVARAEVVNSFFGDNENVLRGVAFAIGRQREIGVDFGVRMRKSFGRV